MAPAVKVTLIVQLAFEAMRLPQVFVSEKSERLAPVITIPVNGRIVLPVFVTVTTCGGLMVPTA